MSVMIGIDPAKGSHAAAAVTGGEIAVAELEVRATRRQTSELLAWAERFPQRSWAIESANGHGHLLAQQLVTVGEHVIDVPSKLAARVRVLDSNRSQKNDANDARSVAIVARRNPDLRVVTAEDHVAVLRMLAKRHKQLASLKTQAAARLHAVLAALLQLCVFVEELVQRIGSHPRFGGRHGSSRYGRRHLEHHPVPSLQLLDGGSQRSGLSGTGGSDDQLQRRQPHHRGTGFRLTPTQLVMVSDAGPPAGQVVHEATALLGPLEQSGARPRHAAATAHCPLDAHRALR